MYGVRCAANSCKHRARVCRFWIAGFAVCVRGNGDGYAAGCSHIRRRRASKSAGIETIYRAPGIIIIILLLLFETYEETAVRWFMGLATYNLPIRTYIALPTRVTACAAHIIYIRQTIRCRATFSRRVVLYYYCIGWNCFFFQSVFRYLFRISERLISIVYI